MHADVVRRLELASELRRAITDGSLGIEYQPVVELATSRVTGVEALVRWSPRRRAACRRGEFLGRGRGLRADRAAGRLGAARGLRPGGGLAGVGLEIGLSVNFSLRQVSAARFAESVLAALEDSGLPHGALTLEVTEQVLVEGAGPMVDGLAELRRHGVRLAIDDFGTGYASLAYLRSCRSTSSRSTRPSWPASAATAPWPCSPGRSSRSVMTWASRSWPRASSGPSSWSCCAAMGCGLGQGYLVARPMTARGIEALAAAAGRAARAGDERPRGAATGRRRGQAVPATRRPREPELGPIPGPSPTRAWTRAEGPSPAAAAAE